jgi:hypothetical protein
LSTFHHELPRFHDKVILEEELNELRRLREADWEVTKLDLKGARRSDSLTESLTRSETCTTVLDRAVHMQEKDADSNWM